MYRQELVIEGARWGLCRHWDTRLGERVHEFWTVVGSVLPVLAPIMGKAGLTLQFRIGAGHRVLAVVQTPLPH